MILGGKCEHCPNQHKELWQTQCRWVQQLKASGWSDEQVQEYDSGSDNPCALDAYDAELIEQVNQDRRGVIWFFALLLAISIIVLLLWLR